MYDFLADLIVATHFGIIAFVALGLLAILMGMLCGWQWVRNPWFRCIHLLVIGIVALESVFDITCPFTVWERDLRRLERPDQKWVAESFIGQWLQWLVFTDLDDATLNVLYISIAVVIVATFWLAPPRFRRPKRDGGDEVQPAPVNAT